MFLFQILFLFIAGFIIFKLYKQYKQKNISNYSFIAWLIFWAGLAYLVINPNLSTLISIRLGIGRGVDLLVFTALVIIFYTLFKIFVKLNIIDSQISKIVEDIAIKKEKINDLNMKIAHIVCSFRPYHSGMGNVAYFMAKEIAKYKHDVDIITPNYRNDKNIEKIDGFNVKRFKPFIKSGNAALPFFSLKEINKYDILHLHYPFFGYHELLSLFYKKKLIITYHMDFIPNSMLNSVLALPSKFLLPRLFQKACKITVSSKDYVYNGQISNLIAPFADKLYELPFGNDDYVYKDNINLQLYNQYNIKKKDKVLLFVGGLDKPHYFKGLDNLLKTIIILPEKIKKNLVLLVVGDGEEKDRYIKYVRNNGLNTRILGRVSDNHLRDLYNLCDCFVLPSINMGEAFGIVLVNAYACSKPVITSNLPGVRTVVENEQTGLLVKPNDIHDLKSKIVQLINDNKKLQNFGKNAYELHKNKYNWAKIGGNLNNLYQSCYND